MNIRDEGHVHAWRWKQNITSRGLPMPPIEVCPCGAARDARRDEEPMAADTDALTERIAGKLCDPARHVARWPLVGIDAYCGQCYTLAAAVLPIVEAEVRAAKAEAWDEGYQTGWTDRDDYGQAESWPFVYDTSNPYRPKTGWAKDEEQMAPTDDEREAEA